ncbi:RmlC-like cupin domain-containing protein [Pyrenochaeta sp. MPI-SDFR-AT-0127]|nr:RmlC-like cupin domain-containing protein [Pyrenochaeta sp. MPI-SDFR-AT-0127]
MSSAPPKQESTPLVLHVDAIEHQPPESFPDANTGGNVSWKTLLSAPQTQTDTLTAGIATCPPGQSAGCAGHLKPHRHSHAELYHVTSGTGVVTIDGVEHEVRKGSVVYIPGDAEHGVQNTGKDEFKWLYVFAADGFGEIVYRFDEDGVKGRIQAKL